MDKKIIIIYASMHHENTYKLVKAISDKYKVEMIDATKQMDEIEPRVCDKEYFHKGDVVIVNSNCHHYRGEVQIVMTDMKNDGERNYVGRISEDEMFLLDHIKKSDAFGFIAK